ncbi:MAG TPA: isoleucine--tRNA ligase [Candidatus Nanoarchaeia archaeon]|nr:isoleucine--tRNA ligase [Candidatus Nanoarchaeia archaeon]
MYDFKQVEDSVAKSWKKQEKEIKRSLQYDSKKKLFSFLEGPPTANAPPALHHVEVRVFKDLVCRFKYMQGYTVPRKSGWDCHGLPVEVQIEKALKLNSKKEILNYGIEEFNKKCRESVFSYIQEWNKLTEKMAFWVDLENPYITMDNEYIESVWWSLKELYNKKLLYEGDKVVPYCPRCETPLSSHEVALGYKEVKEPAIYVSFKIKNAKRYLLAFTTTPWTLPSNLAIGIDKKLTYVVIKEKDREYIVVKEAAKKLFPNEKILEELKGEKLLGLEYEPLFPYFKGLKHSFRTIAVNFVIAGEGTGLIHLAPAFGEDDYEACKENKIDFVKPIDEKGKFTEEIPDFSGLFVKDTDIKIIIKLNEQGSLFKKESYTHSYPFCWRCQTPLIYYAMNSWFIKVSSFRKELLKNNEKITWIPQHIKSGRFGNWLEGAKDWALSRKKFWGTPLPIWRCNNCNNEICIGSIGELKKSAGIKKEIDLHKPIIDTIKIPCKKCKSSMERIPDVIDCWYDSGSASFAQFHYPFENKEMFNKSFPYDFISEAIDQTRGWFYTLHVLGTLLFEKPAYKSVVCAGHIVDELGEKMSKSKGNVINPWEVFDDVGVDACRLQFCINDPGDQKRFGINLLKQQISPFLNILWNSYQYSQNLKSTKKPKLQLEDSWILSRTNTLIQEYTERLEKHDYQKCLSLMTEFVNDDLSRTYIKLIRERSEQDETVGYVFKYIWERISKLLAPFAPYISDYLYQSIENKSVHLTQWSKEDKKMINLELETNMNHTRKVIQEILNERNKQQIGVRWPLSQVEINTKEEQLKAAEKLQELIKLQVNCKKLKFTKTAKEELTIALDTTMTKELEKEGYTREVIRRIQDLRKKAGLKKEDKIQLELISQIKLDELTIKKTVGAEKITKLSNPQHQETFKIKDKEFEIRFNKIK